MEPYRAENTFKEIYYWFTKLYEKYDKYNNQDQYHFLSAIFRQIIDFRLLVELLNIYGVEYIPTFNYCQDKFIVYNL